MIVVSSQLHRPEESLGSPIMEPRPKVVRQELEVRSGHLRTPAECLAHRCTVEQSVQELVGGARELVVAHLRSAARDRQEGFGGSGGPGSSWRRTR